MTDARLRILPDLASRALGGSVMWANDELFAARENLISPGPPAFQPHTFGHKGQIMDGWETRRRRSAGADEAIVRLGAPGVVHGVVVDTSFFTGNYPPEISVDWCAADGHPDANTLRQTTWLPLVARSAVRGDAANEFEVDNGLRFTHVRLTMYPDGGVARLRVHGSIVADPRLLPDCFDLAAAENGGQVVGASNVFYSSPANLIMPGNARVMGDGWETARRRDDGHDWADIQLACRGSVLIAELDTSCFVGNAPGWAVLASPDGRELLPRTALLPDTRHRFVVDGSEPVDAVRLSIFPDGGMARLRLIGRPTVAGREALVRRFIATLPDPHLRTLLQAAGSEPGTIDAILASRPFAPTAPLPDAVVAATRGSYQPGPEKA